MSRNAKQVCEKCGLICARHRIGRFEFGDASFRHEHDTVRTVGPTDTDGELASSLGNCTPIGFRFAVQFESLFGRLARRQNNTSRINSKLRIGNSKSRESIHHLGLRIHFEVVDYPVDLITVLVGSCVH